MKYFYSLLLLIIFSSSYAQIQRAFITKNGKFSNDPKNAISYVLIKKLDVDSAYIVSQYDMHDTIIYSGFYKDELLSIPNGRFTYYNKISLPKGKKSKITSRYNTVIDTNNYIQETGHFVNGKKEGIWIKYGSRGVKQSEIMYENGQKNGSYKLYYSGLFGLYGWDEGIMVNDSLEGKFYYYNGDSLLMTESDYLHNRLKKTIIHLHEATPPDNFYEILEKKTRKYANILKNSDPILVKFIIKEMALFLILK